MGVMYRNGEANTPCDARRISVVLASPNGYSYMINIELLAILQHKCFDNVSHDGLTCPLIAAVENGQSGLISSLLANPKTDVFVRVMVKCITALEIT